MSAPITESQPHDDIGDCDRPDLKCLICNHEACGWCPDCSPGVPDWTDD